MIKTFEYRLYPSRSQERLLAQTLETCRRWYNTCLAERRDAWQQEQRSVSKFEQFAKIKEYRKENPYAAQVCFQTLRVTASDLDKAFQAFFRRVKAGEKPGYPRFKGASRFDSFGFEAYGNGFKLDGRRLKLFGVGRVAVRWHRPIEGKIKTLRIRRRAGKWYACFACDIGQPAPLPETGQVVGIDVGVASLITTSDGEQIPHPKWYQVEQRRLRVLQRRVARRKKGGSRRRKAVLALQRQHERIRNRRKDFLNKLVAGLVKRYDLIAIEDLRISNMVHNRHLSKSILDASWGYFRQQLSFKAAEAGRTVVEVAPAYTSKTCSRCGAIFDNLTLADRWVECECGLSLDRDHNAAINILSRAGQVRQALTSPVGECVA